MSDQERLQHGPESQSSATQHAENSPVVNETAELVEGRVAEIAPKVRQKASGQQGDDGQAQQGGQTAQLTDRELMRQRLLQQAPRETMMREQVQKELVKEKTQLEDDIATYRRKKQYRLLSDALMKLRRVAKQLEELARVGLEQLQDLWLKVVKKFA